MHHNAAASKALLWASVHVLPAGIVSECVIVNDAVHTCMLRASSLRPVKEASMAGQSPFTSPMPDSTSFTPVVTSALMFPAIGTKAVRSGVETGLTGPARTWFAGSPAAARLNASGPGAGAGGNVAGNCKATRGSDAVASSGEKDSKKDALLVCDPALTCADARARHRVVSTSSRETRRMLQAS